MKRRSKPLPALAALALSLAPAAAQAYCRTASCPEHEAAWQVCTPETPDGSDCGEPLWWRSRCIGFTLQKDASSQVDLATAQKVFEEAFATWMNASCESGGHPSIAVEYQGPVECDVQEYNKEKGNANIIMFRDDSWPYGPGVLAPRRHRLTCAGTFLCHCCDFV